GAIEAMVERPPDARTDTVGVCCHPHPLYGGTMQNKVVHTLARACQDQKVTTLRFNFRGVGASAGAHDDGAGESEDAAAVADFARAATGAARLWSLGFSFGGFVAYRLATARSASALVTVAPPVQRFDFTRLAVPRCPWLVAQGDADELVDHERVLAWARTLEPAPEVRILPGAEHFLHGRLTELRALLGPWLAARAVESG
ncbi:MAG TPA: alpha/beta fold hydrolase, partial [Steroidobacteraceae bacterium]|nr:alpha/beta fold hydrolase [Steroidobacteraceae bacterium]